MCTVGRCDTVPVKLCVHLPQPVKIYLGTCILESTVCIQMACMYEYKSSLAWTCIVKRRSVCVTCRCGVIMYVCVIVVGLVL